MYSLFLRNIDGFVAQGVPDSYTEKCFRPIQLLGKIEEFKVHKNGNTDIYQNAKVLIKAAEKLIPTKKYHRFGVLIRELEEEGICFDDRPVEIEVNEEVLTEQISLLWQCMFFNYVFV